jgi:hypothetical protein
MKPQSLKQIKTALADEFQKPKRKNLGKSTKSEARDPELITELHVMQAKKESQFKRSFKSRGY